MTEKAHGASGSSTSEWDVESRTELVSVPEGHLKGSSLYVTAALWTRMRESWGGRVTHIKTKTDLAKGEVQIFKAKPGEPGAVKVHTGSPSSNVAEFSLFRPLKKLGVEVPKDRMLIITPDTEEVAGLGTVYVFPVIRAQAVPRKAKDAAAAKLQP